MKEYFDITGKKMTQGEYLYGKDSEVKPISKKEVNIRIKALKKHLDELFEVPFMSRDGARCNAVIRAIKFWEHIGDL